MKKIILTISAFIILLNVSAQTDKLAGPRVGFTIISAGPIADFIKTKDLDRLTDDAAEFGEFGTAFMTQYGWQWETRFADGYDVTGLVEWVFMVGGLDQGLFLPSVSSLIGLRTSSNLEFALGPNLSLSGIGGVIAVGYNFKVGEINLPVNIAFRPGIDKIRDRDIQTITTDANGITQTSYNTVEEPYNTGSLISLIVGFNLGD